MYCYQNTLAVYPPTLSVQPFPDNYRDVGIHDIAPYRVYLISLQHYLYILSVALFLVSQLVAINHYIALWCSDFPLPKGSDKAIYLLAKVNKLLITHFKICSNNSNFIIEFLTLLLLCNGIVRC